MTNANNQEAGEFSRSWTILVAATLGLAVGVHALPFYTAGTFMAPLMAEFGWTRAQLSLGPTLLTLVLAFTAPLVGGILDKWGERVPILFSLLTLSALLALLSWMTGNIIIYWALFAGMALFGAGSGTLPFSRVVSAAFVARRGTALGIALTGAGLTSTFAPRLASASIEKYGWETTYLIMALVVLVATPLVVLPLRRRKPMHDAVPAAATAASDGDVSFSDAIRTGTFWRLAIAFPLIGLSTIGMVVHFVPLLRDSGIGAAEAGSIAGLIGVSMIVARLVSGVLMDLVFAPWVGAGAMSICAAGLLLLATGDPALAWCGAIAIGLSIGIEFDLIAYLTARYFGLSAFGRIYGWLYGLTALGVSGSSLAYGYWADAAGSYRPALLCATGLLVISVIIFLTLPRFDSSRRAAA